MSQHSTLLPILSLDQSKHQMFNDVQKQLSEIIQTADKLIKKCSYFPLTLNNPNIYIAYNSKTNIWINTYHKRTLQTFIRNTKFVQII